MFVNRKSKIFCKAAMYVNLRRTWKATAFPELHIVHFLGLVMLILLPYGSGRATPGLPFHSMPFKSARALGRGQRSLWVEMTRALHVPRSVTQIKFHRLTDGRMSHWPKFELRSNDKVCKGEIKWHLWSKTYEPYIWRLQNFEILPPPPYCPTQATSQYYCHRLLFFGNPLPHPLAVKTSLLAP